MGCLDIPNETVFTMEMTPIKVGAGATDEVAYDLKRLGVRHALIITDRGIMKLGLPERVRTLLHENGITADIFDDVHVEPTDKSFEAISSFVHGRDYDGFVAIGGGSSIDSAKAANLFTTYPAPVLDYVNKPIGKGLPVPGPLKPLVAIPTTAGTGSETTAVTIMDVLSLKVKTGISHRYLRPTMAIIDPLNTVTLPPMATAYPGFDVLTHALESYTSRPYDARPRHTPEERPVYVGSNPISDLWCEKALEYLGRYLRRAVLNGMDVEARTYMALAATYAGIGFGNAGVHVPHSIAYPIAGLVKNFSPPDYPKEEPMIPHGLSVIVTAPATFRWTYPVSPERHLRAAQLLGANVSGLTSAEMREVLPNTLLSLMHDTGIPNGLSALGYSDSDVSPLIEGTLKQQRLLVNCPRSVGAEELQHIIHDSFEYW
ncbi:MAG TPA: hydroxyacid-oxoacid transhydrogenase [Ktedonobacteraceae bacterium]|nr:hydroxyacid-oxoacid transhydrogenase [Ktedonobacteraceae bacterium]